MSHIVKCKVEMKNVDCLNRAIRHLGLENLGNRKQHQLFGGQKADGIAVKLPGWTYPVVINPESGEAVYDNYGGNWGKQEELDKLVQRYAIETTIDQAIAGGYTYEENRLPNGDVELLMTGLVTT